MKTIREMGGFVFPEDPDSVGGGGMTLRDYFAARAMQALAQRDMSDQDVAKFAYGLADAMVEESSKAWPELPK